ncbi:glutathione S-transferase T3-like protein [Tanacetum coccineum]
MLRESLDFSEESVEKSWGKELAYENGLEFIPCFDSLLSLRVSDNAFRSKTYIRQNFESSLQENTAYWQEPNTYEAAGERVATSPTKKKKKATRNCQKRAIQTDDAPRQTAWTTKEEITLAKGWHAIFENSQHGNARKKDGFWCEVLAYIESKIKQEGRWTYDMVVGKWKTVYPAVVRFCGVYGNVMRMVQESGAGDKDYVQRSMIYYQDETGVPFKFRHCWDVLKDSPKFQEIAFPNFNQGSEGSSKRHKSSGSSSFNTESGDASINLNTTTVADEDEGPKASGSSTMNDDALARLMVNEMTSAEVNNAKHLWSSKGGRSNVVNERLQLRSIEHNKKY